MLIVSGKFFLWLRLDTFLSFSIFSFFIILLSLPLFHYTPFFVFRFKFTLPDKQCQYPSATRRAKNVYSFLAASKPERSAFKLVEPLRDLDLISRKAVFPAALRHTKPARAPDPRTASSNRIPLRLFSTARRHCKPYAALYPIRHTIQTALRLFKAHAAFSSRPPPAHSNGMAPRITRHSHRSTSLFTALSAIEQ